MASQELTVLRRILSIQRRIGIHPGYYIPPILLSVCSVIFESAGMGLLVPMVNGFLTKDFSFLRQTPAVRQMLSLLPAPVSTSDQSLFLVLLGFFVVAILFKNLFKYLSGVSMSYVAIRSIHRLRRLLFDRYLQFGKLYFDRSNLGHDTTIFAHFAKYALRPLLMSDKYVNAFFSLIGYLVVMSLISWQLTLFALPLFVILHVAIRRIVQRMHALSGSLADATSTLAKQTTEILSLAPFVQSFNMQDKEKRRFGRLSEDSSRLSFRMAVIQELIPPFQEFITLLAAVLLFSGMLYLLARQGIGSPPSFIVYFYLVLNAAAKFRTVSNARGVLAEARGNVDEVLTILSDEQKYKVPDGTVEFTGLRETIEFSNLRFSYQDAEVLKGVSFRIDKGKITALVGATGAGKTTIIQILLRHYDCPPESILVDGTDLRTFTHESLRRHMAIVSQDVFLLHDTLRFNVSYGTEGLTDGQVWDALECARLAAFVRKLPQGLDTLIGDRGVKLSGGEKQRLSIARALLRGADILILDEATSSLDSTTERLIQEAIEEAVEGKTAIVIAHRLSTIKDADRIVVLADGQVAEQGTLEELLEREGVLRTFWDDQVRL